MGATVLIVDDDPIVLHVVESVLTRAGYEVLATISPAIGIEMAHMRRRVDVLVADATLGGTCGLALSRILQRFYPELRAILMSGWDRETLSERGLITPSNIFLPKPFTTWQILDAVQRAFADELRRSPKLTR